MTLKPKIKEGHNELHRICVGHIDHLPEYDLITGIDHEIKLADEKLKNRIT